MIELAVPGFGQLRLEYLVLDFNGTLALDGKVFPGLRERLADLDARLSVHVLTADTFGSAGRELADFPVILSYLAETAPGLKEDEAKERYVRSLDASAVCFMGQGMNDRLALSRARLGVCVLQSEGAAPASLTASDVVVPNVLTGLDLLLHPKRLLATLRY